MGEMGRQNGAEATAHASSAGMVAIRIIAHYGFADPDVISAALLHNAVEDHAGDLAPGGGHARALAQIAAWCGNRFANLVATVTNPEPEPGKDRHQLHREHIAHALEASPWARVIKASDFTDNGVGWCTPAAPSSTSSPASTRRSSPSCAR